MKEFKVLCFLDKLAPVFEKLGADYVVMRKILQMKLVMDGRRVPTIFNNNKKKQGEDDNNNFIKSLWMYIFMGLILIPFVAMKNNYIFQMSMVFGIIIFMIMSTLISDFSSVLLDVRDKNIIGTKPVSSKTLNLAKTIHIAIYMFYITIALTGPALVLSLFTQGIAFFLLFVFSIILLDMFIIVLTALIYLCVLKFFDGEKLKDIINYVQIILSIGIAVSYQFIGRLFDVVNLKIEFTTKWWQYFIIPIWFAAPFQIIKKAEVNIYYIVYTILALAVPIAAMLIYIKLIPSFERNLQKLNNNTGNSKRSRKKLNEFLAKVLCKDREERIFFRFASDMMKNEREFKLKVYPLLGFSAVLPLILVFQQLSDTSIKELSRGKSYFFIYFSGLMLPTLVSMIKYSGKYKSAWIYKALPIKSAVPIFRGTIKALIINLLLPIYMFIVIIFLFLFGPRILPDIFAIFLNLMIYIIIYFAVSKKSLPFSEAFTAGQQGDVIISMLMMFLLLIIGVIHGELSRYWVSTIIFLVISIVGNIVLWNKAFNVPNIPHS